MNKRARGFTLIELMIAVAIVGILAAIAYPSYLDQVRKSRRTDAISLLTQAANRQERYYTTQYEYAKTMTDLGLPDETENSWYTLKIENADKDGYDLIAKAQKDQKNDNCTQYTLNQLGEKKASGPGSSSDAECW